jgi:RNA polymerase sigma-70 factor, ECF subfamily
MFGKNHKKVSKDWKNRRRRGGPRPTTGWTPYSRAVTLLSVNTSAQGTSNLAGEGGRNAEDIRGLVRKARAGEEGAFGELVKTFHQRVYGLAYSLVNNEDDARDLAQQTWVKVWHKLGSFKEDAGFFTWVYRVASNTCLDFLRGKTRRKEDALPEGMEPVADARVERAPSEVSRPDREMERAEIKAIFEKSLAELSPEHRLALTLREVDGLSYDEIAKVMGCRKGTVMSRIFYARQKMQEKLRELQ